MKVFIGSSTEASINGYLQKIAVIVEQCGMKPIKWNQTPSIFKAGMFTLENLEELPSKVNGSIFICTADDKTWYRGQEVGKPRDNVIFEHGLFTGRLGRRKSLIIIIGNVSLPNDLNGLTYIDFSDGKQMTGEANLIQFLEDLKGGKNVIPLISYEELEKTKSEIERELDIIKTKGLEKIFNNQGEAVADFRKTYTNSNTPIKILCIRGESFVSNRNENWGSVLPLKSTKTVILGNPDNDEIIMNRYNANKNNDENTADFLERYREDMKAVHKKMKIRPECSLYIHNEITLRYRMLFVDNFLYLSRFATTTASQSEVIKIPKDYALYGVCEDHYNQILANATKV